MAEANGSPIPSMPDPLTDEQLDAEFAQSGLSIPSFQDLMKPEVEIRGVHFAFRGMQSWPAYQLLEQLRPGIAMAAGARAEEIPAGTNVADAAMVSLIAIFGALPLQTMELARTAMSQHTYFTRDTHPSPTQLFRNEQAAFAGLLPYHVYEINIRNFYRNFHESWVELRSILPGTVVALLRSQLQTSPGSSFTPSMQDSSGSPTSAGEGQTDNPS